MGQTEMEDPHGIEELHATQDDGNNEIIIGGRQPHIGGGGHPTHVDNEVKMMVDQK